MAAEAKFTQFPKPLAAWATVAILFVLSVIAVLDRNIVTLLVAPIKAHFDLTDVQVSLIIGAAFALPHGVLGIPIGWAVDRLQRRFMLVVGILTWSLATAATGLANSFAQLFAARSLVGVGEASLSPTVGSMVSDLFPRERIGLPISVIGMGYKVGQGVALVIGGALIAAFPPGLVFSLPLFGGLLGWQLIFIIVGLPGLIFALLLIFFREPARNNLGHAEDVDSSLRAYGRFVRAHRRFFITHHLGMMLTIAMVYALLSWMPAFLGRVHHWHEDRIGAWLGMAMTVAPLLGMPLHGALSDHLLRRGWTDIHIRYPMCGVLVGVPFAVAALIVPSPVVAVLFAGIFIFAIASYTSLPVAAVVSLTPSRLRGKATAVMNIACTMPGVALGPLLVGTLTDKVFHDTTMVGRSIMLCFLILAPLILFLWWQCLKPLRALAAIGTARHDPPPP